MLLLNAIQYWNVSEWIECFNKEFNQISNRFTKFVHSKLRIKFNGIIGNLRDNIRFSFNQFAVDCNSKIPLDLKIKSNKRKVEFYSLKIIETVIEPSLLFWME